MNASLETILKKMVEALSDEITEAKRQGGQKFYIYDGRLIASDSEGYLYAFFFDSEIHLMEESRVTLKAGRLETDATVVGLEANTILLKLDESIGRKVVEAQMSANPWFLLEALKGQLSTLLNEEKPIVGLIDLLLGLRKTGKIEQKGVRGLINAMGDRIGQKISLNSSQDRAIGKILGSEQVFVWGPPGTGKTQTLALSVAALLEWGDTILLTAHSNAALDVAIEKMVTYMRNNEQLKNGRVVRLGTPRRLSKHVTDLVSVEALLSREPAAAALIEEIKRLREEASQIRAGLSGATLSKKTRNENSEKLGEIYADIKTAKTELQQYEQELILNSCVLCCTLSKLAIEPSLQEKRFKALVADEVSMALIPGLALASTLIDEKLFLFGDFRQLPPIALSKTPISKDWLQNDIFEKAGIVQKVDRDEDDERLAKLVTQYRMHPEISRICNKIAYNGELQDAEFAVKRSTQIASKSPFSNRCLLYLDTSEFSAHCHRDNLSRSRYNPLSAALTYKMARQCLADGHTNIGIITPYAAQARLLGNVLMDAGLIETIKVSTVHKFQGDECNVIIFDLVDSPPIPEVGIPLRGESDSQALRLINVAISRAVGKLFLIGNFSYFKSRLRKAETLRTVITHFEEHGHGAEPKWLSTVIGRRDGSVDFFKGVALREQLQSALSATKTEAAFVLNDDFSFLYDYLDAIKEIGKGHSILIGGLSKHVDGFVGKINNLKVWYRKAPHEQIILLDKNQLWLIFKEDDFYAVRFQGERVGKVVAVLLDTVPNEARQSILASDGTLAKTPFGKCPNCRNKLWPEGRLWGIAMACTSPNCQHCRKATNRELTAYIQLSGYTCDVCGGQLRVISGNGKYPFVGCSNYPQCQGFKPKSVRDFVE